MITTRRGFLGLFAGMSAIPEVKSIERLIIKPQDVLVVSVGGHASVETLNHIKRLVENQLPDGVKVLVHTSDISLSVLRKEDQ